MTTSIPSSRRRRSKTPGYIGLVILGALVLVFAVSFTRERVEESAAHDLQSPVPPTPAALAEGKTNYNLKCASCHGSSGDGKGDKAQGLWKTPTDFRNAAKMDRRTDGDLYWVTTKGSWPMPAFEDQFSDLERWQLVDYIRAFSETQKPSP
ncbi:MAG: c-type cytochrome [Candidatus Acidiferrales bacterium]